MSGFFNLMQLWRSWVACRWPKCFVGFLQGACMCEWAQCTCIKKKKKKKSFSLKRAEKGSVTSMKVNDASFPCPPSAPSHMLFIILEGETLAHPGIFPFQILFSAYPLQGSHGQILADWSGGCEEGGLQFMAGEESLDSKCIWKRGRESDTEDHRGSSKLLVLPFPMGKERKWWPQLQLLRTQMLCLCNLQSTRAFIQGFP